MLRIRFVNTDNDCLLITNLSFIDIQIFQLIAVPFYRVLIIQQQ